MNLGFPAQERLTQNALTVGVRCVNRTRKHAASVTAYSVLRACPSIQCSTPKLHQQTTGKIENEKGLKNYGTAASDAQGFFHRRHCQRGDISPVDNPGPELIPNAFGRQTGERSF